MPHDDLDYGVAFGACATVENPSEVRERFLGFCEDRLHLQKANNFRVIGSPQQPVACANYIILGKNQIPNDIIFHYTSRSVLKSILENKELWLSHYSSMNDVTELEHSFGLLWYAMECHFCHLPSLELYNSVRQAFMSDLGIYLTSFSRSPNLLSQWRSYASEDGVSIGFSAQLFAGKNYPDVNLVLDEVIYDEALQLERLEPLAIEFAEIINRLGDDLPDLQRELEKSRVRFCRVAAFLKNGGFAEEKEVRLIAFGNGAPRHSREGRYGEVEFVKLSLADLYATTHELDVPICYVITGPSRDPDVSVAAVTDMLYQHKTKFYAVFDCAIPLR